jgi:hypothetical protein
VVEKEARSRGRAVARSRGRRGVITWKRQLINQEEKVVQEGVTLTLVEVRAAAGRQEEESPLQQDSGQEESRAVR